jgi:hypothetical protein
LENRVYGEPLPFWLRMISGRKFEFPRHVNASEKPAPPTFSKRLFGRELHSGSQTLSLHRFACPLVDGIVLRVRVVFRGTSRLRPSLRSSTPRLARLFLPGSTLPAPRSLRLWFRLPAFVNARARSPTPNETSSTFAAYIVNGRGNDRVDDPTRRRSTA